LVLERHFAVQQLVDLTAPRGIKEDDSLAAHQALSQVYPYLEPRLPRAAFLGRSPDLDVDPLGRNALVRCDRSECERDSTAQRSADQFDRAGVGARVVVASLDLEEPLADLDLGAAVGVPDAYSVGCHQTLSTWSQSATVTPGVSTERWA
jgi:hypothetical protein